MPTAPARLPQQPRRPGRSDRLCHPRQRRHQRRRRHDRRPRRCLQRHHHAAHYLAAPLPHRDQAPTPRRPPHGIDQADGISPTTDTPSPNACGPAAYSPYGPTKPGRRLHRRAVRPLRPHHPSKSSTSNPLPGRDATWRPPQPDGPPRRRPARRRHGRRRPAPAPGHGRSAGRGAADQALPRHGFAGSSEHSPSLGPQSLLGYAGIRIGVIGSILVGNPSWARRPHRRCCLAGPANSANCCRPEPAAGCCARPRSSTAAAGHTVTVPAAWVGLGATLCRVSELRVDRAAKTAAALTRRLTTHR